jgi:transcriptional regulator with XRE-family HTH domain
MLSHIKMRLAGLPAAMRTALVTARQAHGWSQAALGKRVGLPQAHVSHIETGKTSPHFNTLLDLVRVLDYDLLLVPRALVPATQALIRDHRRPDSGDPDDGERPLYARDPYEESGDAS